MTVEYDLAIVGGSAAGRYAAAAAAALKARVALVEPPGGETISGEMGTNLRLALNQVGRLLQQCRMADSLELFSGAQQDRDWHPGAVDWVRVWQWAEGTAKRVLDRHALAVLASQGVDTIVGAGEFCRRPQPAFVVEGRPLRSRAYLIAPALRSTIPAIDGLHITGYCTTETLGQLAKRPERPQRLAVMGDGPLATELAQTFSRLGCQVALLVRSPQILPRLDAEAAQWIQAQLEMEGVRVFTHSRVLEVKPLADKKWIQVGDWELETDEIILAVGQQLDLTGLNLAAVGVQPTHNHILLNDKLQTTNRQIYVCGQPPSDTYASLQRARYEASVAVKNALFWPRHRANALTVPGTVFSDPELAWVGLTEDQAQQRYGEDAWVLKQALQSSDRAQLRGDMAGFCKLIVHRQGRILGAQLVGPDVAEWVGAIALAQQQRLKIDAIANLPCPSPTLSDLYRQTAAQWQKRRLKRNHRLEDWLAGFFHWRRSWSK